LYKIPTPKAKAYNYHRIQRKVVALVALCWR